MAKLQILAEFYYFVLLLAITLMIAITYNNKRRQIVTWDTRWRVRKFENGFFFIYFFKWKGINKKKKIT